MWDGWAQYGNVTMYELDDLGCMKANAGYVWYVYESGQDKGLQVCHTLICPCGCSISKIGIADY